MGLWTSLDGLLKKGKEKFENLMQEELEAIPKEDQKALETGLWYQIKDTVSIAFRIEDSTRLSGQESINAAAEIHRQIAESLRDILKEFNAGFIDVGRDYGFALWKEKFGSVKALLSGLTFKNSVEKKLQEQVKNRSVDLEVAIKIGIVKGTVLFKREGPGGAQGRTSGWAVWGGDTINSSTKLSAVAAADTILVSENVFADFSIPPELSQYLILSCDCYQRIQSNLWQEKNDLKELSGMKVFELKGGWCDKHRQAYWDNVSIIINK